jgi:hypothetical protein
VSEKARHYAAAALGVIAVLSLASGPRAPAPTPDDSPARIVLAGKFVGPTAASDAARLSALTDELARVLQADGQREGGPRLKTGIQFDELRIAAREMRMRGESIGERQPKVRDEVCHFLNEAVGVSGGPVTPEQRAKWVDSFFEISREASRAAGK